MGSVDVVIAVHAGVPAEHLSECMDSIQRQNFSGTIKTILVADGNLTEKQIDTINQVSRKAGDDRMVQLVVNKNRSGPGGARNTGMDVSTGEFIAILDSDDFCDSERIQTQYDFLKDRPEIDVLGTCMKVVDEDSRETGTRGVVQIGRVSPTVASLICPMNNPSIMMRAERVRGFRYSEGNRLSEDYFLWIDLLKEGRTLFNLSSRLTSYRQSESDLKKRGGFRYLVSDLRAKLRAIASMPLPHAAMVAPLIIIICVVRLVPGPMRSVVYKAVQRLKR